MEARDLQIVLVLWPNKIRAGLSCSDIIWALPNMIVGAVTNLMFVRNSIEDKKGPCVHLCPNVPLADG